MERSIMKLLTVALLFTVFVVMSPVASGAQLVKENLSIKKECPTIKDYTGNSCLYEAPNPTPATLIFDIIKSWDVTCHPQPTHSEKCEIKQLIKHHHPLSLEVMRVVYGWIYKDQKKMDTPRDWRDVWHGLSLEYFKVVHNDIDRKAIDQAQAFAGVKFYDLAMEAARAANKFKTSDDIDDLKIAYEFKFKGETNSTYKGRYSGGLKNGKPHGIGLFVTEGRNQAVFRGHWCNGRPYGPVLLTETHFGMNFYGKFAGLVEEDGDFIWSTNEAGVHPLGTYFGAFVGYRQKYSEKSPVNWWNRKVTKAELKKIPNGKRNGRLKVFLGCKN